MGNGKGVLKFLLMVTSEEFGVDCGGTAYQDSLTLAANDKTLFVTTIGDFCKLSSQAKGAKGTFPFGLYPLASGNNVQRTPWIQMSIPVAGFDPSLPIKLTAATKSVGDSKYRTLFLLDDVAIMTAEVALCKADSNGSNINCCQPILNCDLCSAQVNCAACAGQDCDSDGIKNPVDNCPTAVNVDQKNADADSLGDICDYSPCILMTCSDVLRQICAITGNKPNCCTSAENCYDGDSCTNPVCSAGTCSQTLAPGCCKLDSDCGDQNDCTKDTCVAGACLHKWICGG